jgi:nickel-dependent lactate racemase
MAIVRYGNNSTVQLDFADGAASAESGTPHGEPLADLDAAMRAALAAPLNFPPLAQCTTPADQVVIALDAGIPRSAQISAAVIHNLVEAGIDPDGITVLQTQADSGAEANDPCQMLPAILRERVTVLNHDPTDRRQLAYLAASESGEAILINRTLHEADIVLPVGCVRADETAGYFGIHSPIFPAFSDAKTIQRFRGFGSLNGRGNRRRELTAEVDHVAWLLGVNFTIQVVPAVGDRVLHVLCGESESVRQRGRELYCAAWSWSAPQRANLVVAAIEGDASQQSWENVGRALQAAEAYIEEDGAIVVCSELAIGPGPGLQRFAHTPSRDSALRHVGKERPADALPAAQLANALEQHKVYLLSRLEASVVEDLDVIPVAGPDELNRLVRQYQSCILLSNAHNVTTVEEHHGDTEGTEKKHPKKNHK